jgi:hypothetical protein
VSSPDTASGLERWGLDIEGGGALSTRRSQMTTAFKAHYSKPDAFHARADLLRPMFGLWHCCDPVSHAILDIVEAQNELADAFDDDAHCCGSEAAFKAVIEKREAAGRKLLTALVNRQHWPDPELGND